MGWAPAAIEAGLAIWGAIEQQKQQSQAAAAAQQLNTQEGGLIGTLTNDASWIQPVLNAIKGGVATMKSQVGGVANMGDLAKTVLGSGLETAISGSLADRGSRIQSAIGDISALSGRAAGTANAGNPWLGLGSTLGAIDWSKLFGHSGSPGSGVAPGGSDIAPPVSGQVSGYPGETGGGGLWNPQPTG
jgi:hypothetical protein